MPICCNSLPLARNTRTADVGGVAPLQSLDVVAMRRSPFSSLIENWFSSWRGSSPDAMYDAVPFSPSENLWMSVGGCFGFTGATPLVDWYQSHDIVAR